MNRRTLLIGASALGFAVFGGGAFFLNRQRQAEAEAIASATPAVDPALLVRPHSPSFGPEDAPVTLVEFFDPSCEACRAVHPLVQEVRRQFPTELRVVLRYTLFHEGSDVAAQILEAARLQDKFEPVLDALFDKQPTWAVHTGPRMDLAWQIAGAVGLDLARAQTDKFIPGIASSINQDTADVEALRIKHTPTFFLRGKLMEISTGEKFLTDVRRAVEGA